MDITSHHSKLMDFCFFVCLLLSFPCTYFFSFFLLGGHWNEIQNRREFFDNFALSHGFDPLVPQHWYPVTQQQVLETKVWLFLYYSIRSFSTFIYVPPF